MGTGGHGCSGSSDGNPEPKNGLSRSRGGKGVGSRESRLARHRDIPQPRGKLAWLEFGVSQLGSRMDAASISLESFSQLVLLSPSYHTVTYHGASSPIYPGTPSLSCCKTPWTKQGRCPWEQNPALTWGICEQPCTFWDSAKIGCSKSHPIQPLGFWRGWRMVGHVPGVRHHGMGSAPGWWYPARAAPCRREGWVT